MSTLAANPAPPVKLTALERDVLTAAYQATNRTLRRIGSGFVAAPRFTTSGPAITNGFTKRIALRLHREGLLQLDDEVSPSTLTLTDAGAVLVRTLLAPQA